MSKKILQSVMIGFCVFVATLIIAYIAYVYSFNLASEKTKELLSEPSAVAETLEPLSPAEVISVDHYVARIDGNKLCIYAVDNAREEFLYTLDARIEDISQEELIGLKRGITLSDRQALASFEEDFTS